MSKMLIKTMITGIMFSSVLQAGEAVKNNQNFYSEITKFSTMCLQNICEAPYAKKVIYDYLKINKIDANFKKIMERIAYKQAQIWGDTILEGDYAAVGNTRLDQVSNLYKNSELVGYLITYSEKAWDTGNCRYDGIRDSTLIGCLAGRIVESSYVSLDFKDYFYDEKTAAVFLLDKQTKSFTIFNRK